MSRDDLYDVLVIAFWLVVFYEIGYFLGRYHERIIYRLIALYYNKEEKSKDESTTLSTE